MYLRARYYVPNLGSFASLDPLELDNRYAYVGGNVVNRVDPSGMISCPPGFEPIKIGPNPTDYECRPYSENRFKEVVNNSRTLTCPIGEWDCEAVRNVYSLKSVFLDSASRHNRVPGMSSVQFASMVASIIIGEKRLGRVDPNKRLDQTLEDVVASLGCVVSGNYINEALSQHDYGLVYRYLTNQQIPPAPPIYAYASVGIGNIKLPTAESLWTGQFCNWEGNNCVNARVSPLMTRNFFGWIINIPNPFVAVTCTSAGCVSSQRSQLAAYEIITTQLIDWSTNIEYVSAILEAGALRIQALGGIPTMLNSVMWYIRSAQTPDEIDGLTTRLKLENPTGHATGWVASSMPIAEKVLTTE